MSSGRERSVPRQRVLIVHNYYQQAGGEDMVVANEMRLLRERGHDVALHSTNNHAISGLASKVRAFRDLTYNPASRDELLRKLETFAPDVVHVHNFFPLLTTSIYDACQAYGVPVVQTLHNYRITCAGAFLLREGKFCDKCVGGTPYWSVVHRCYRGSLVGSVALSRMIEFNGRRGTWRTKVERFIALTQFAKEIYVRAGVPGELIEVKPNFADDPGEPGDGARSGAVYVGRLSDEKGVRVLVEGWRSLDMPLRIVGDGPLLEELRAIAPPSVTFVGRLAHAEVSEELRRAAMLVIPSTNVEGFPMVLAEAFSHALPCIVSDLGAMREVVEDGVTGRRFTPGDPAALAHAVKEAARDPERLAQMGRMARQLFLDKYGPDANYVRLIKIYRDCTQPKKAVATSGVMQHLAAE